MIGYRSNRAPLQRLLLLACAVLAGMFACDGDDDLTHPVSVGGEQTETLHLMADAVVDVDGSLSFAVGLSPAMVLAGNATFRMDANAEFVWPDEWQVPAGAHITIQSKTDSEFWDRIRIPVRSTIQLENLVIRQARIGVFAEDVAFLGLNGVTISDCQQYGAYVSQSDSFSLQDTRISDCTDFCLSARFTRGSITGCTFENAERGLDNISSPIRIRDCTFRSNATAGVYVQGAGADVDIEYCDFKDNYNAFYNNERTAVRFVHNNVQHQESYALHIRRPIPAMLVEQNNILPGGVENNLLLRVQPSIYLPQFYLHAGNNWWGTTDTTVIRAGLIDGYMYAHTDTIRISPVLPAPVADAGPR